MFTQRCALFKSASASFETILIGEEQKYKKIKYQKFLKIVS